MNIFAAVMIVIVNLILLTIIFFVLYLVVTPLVYVPSTTEKKAIIGQATLFLTQMSQTLVIGDLSTNPYHSIVNCKVNIPSASLTDVTMLPSSRSNSYQPPYNTNFPMVFTSLTNIPIDEGDEISIEMLVSTRVAGTNRTTSPVQTIIYDTLTVDSFKPEYIYITPTGLYSDSGRIVNNVVLTMTGPVAGNLSLRLLLSSGDDVEICYIDDTFSGQTGTSVTTFFTGQQVGLYENNTLLTIFTEIPIGLTEITCSSGGGMSFVF